MENEISIREIFWPKDRRGTIEVNCPEKFYTQPIAKCEGCNYYKGLVFGKGVKCDYKEGK
jgi:hypothetical protein